MDFENLASKDDKVRFAALTSVLEATEVAVPWAYDVWDGLVARLGDESSFQRSIGAMVLCNLARSDSKNRMQKDLPKLLALTEDEKFITSRQCIQAIWKVAAQGKALQKRVVDHLEGLFASCERTSAHPNLIREDIMQSLRKLHEKTGDESVKARAKEMIALEKEAKHRKKYEAVWRG